jgi:toxin-antitoxin system PIN domain toxin
LTYLLDVNVLIALIDPAHAFADAAHRWFERTGRHGWASCPLTQNGGVRILGNPSYPGGPGTPAAASILVQGLCAHAGHVFWPDDISLLGAGSVRLAALTAAKQITDTYLLALAVSKRGTLATFDRRLSTDTVQGGAEALHVLG